MSKTTAPLLSFDARGQLGETLVYSSWKGRPYARRYVIPANPRTAAQTQTRDTFRGLNSIWRYLPAAAIGAWNLYADNSRITARNAWLKQNVSPLRPATDLQPILLSPAAGGGLTLQSMTATPAIGGATIDVTVPELPTGWTITATHAMAIQNVDPHDPGTPDIAAASATAAPWDITLGGMTTGVQYVVGAWMEVVKSSGQTAYGASLQALVTPT